ncbi:succinate-semialdehyde dehydrogenase [Candidatus Roizmanbacteria bacterium CG06_land_8_20_14_3_00_34_14]|uniref:Succinate-semialdehyde dehydrogenase n=4 Tax=Candidatus Roizmaniibacteriota TaxID=1752723 RepID=A0A2M7AUP5_9BACT|nr:MAG: succinate-semialdehyde dehydrogenase [Candidatus Roizmanbacteria bacterium CG06_land_8_20_14_3_00_34_14]
MKKLLSINPATEEIFGEFPILTENELENKINLSHEAFKKWKKVPFSEKKVLMKKVGKILLLHKQKFAKMITMEMGKNIEESTAEVEKCATLCEFLAGSAEAILKKEIIKTEAEESYIRFEPLGVIFSIMPWNYPFWQVFRAAVPALMVGNTMLLKLASNVPQTSQLIEKIFIEAGFPKGVFQNLLIDSSMSEIVIKSNYVRGVTLTGSEKAGSAVASLAGASIKKSILELGGSDPFIVLDDADIKKASLVATSARLSVSGQVCISAKRFIIQKKIANEFIRELTKNFKEIENKIGPLSGKKILETIEDQVNSSVKMGAKIITGGKRIAKKGYFYPPTIIADVTKKMPLYFEEAFGPVATIFIVEDDAETIKIANDTKFGLGASVWTNNKKRAQLFIEELESGSVFINNKVTSNIRLPFGGSKNSGYGRELSSYGLKEFVNIKTVVIEKQM